MRRFLLFAVLAAIVVVPASLAEGQDAGVPDTLYVEVFPQDECVFGEPPHPVRFPIYVTSDIVDHTDSIAGFVIPLFYRRNNPDKYCSTAYWWNTIDCDPHSPSVQENRSIFRHLPSMQNPNIHNRMLDMASDFSGRNWDYVALDLVNQVSKFLFCMIPTGYPDQRWWEGSRVLLATITFTLEDTMTICVYDSVWPPGGRLTFSNSDAESYIPVNFFPVYQTIGLTDRGDANGDGIITVSDALYLLNYLFHGGPPPVSFVAGDVNSDDDLGVLDPLYLLNYLYKGGPPPRC
jgi:hypothetical protein